MDSNWLTKGKDTIAEIALRPGAVRPRNKLLHVDKNRLTPAYIVPEKPKRNSVIEDQYKCSSRNRNELTLRSLANNLIIYSYIPADSQSTSYQGEFVEKTLASTYQQPDTLEYAKLFQKKGFQEVTSALNVTSDVLPDKSWRPYLTKVERRIWIDPIKKTLNKKPTLTDPNPLAFNVPSTPGRTATYKYLRGSLKDRSATFCMSCNASELVDTQAKSYRNVLVGDPLVLTTPKKTKVTLVSWSPYLTDYERKIWKIDVSALIPIRDEFVGNDSLK